MREDFVSLEMVYDLPAEECTLEGMLGRLGLNPETYWLEQSFTQRGWHIRRRVPLVEEPEE